MDLYNGFTYWEGNAVKWDVYHREGITFVHAITEVSAYERFKRQYPNRDIIKIVRG